MDMHQAITQFHVYLLTEKRVAHNTFESYRRDINQFIAFIMQKSFSLTDLTIKEIKLFLKHLHDLNFSARTMVRKIAALRIFFAYLAEKYNIKNNTHEILFPKIEKKLPHYLSEQEIKALFQVVDKDTSLHAVRNKAMLYLLYATGLRISELIMLSIADIHFDSGFIAVQGKGGKQRHIPVPSFVLTLVRDYCEQEHRFFAQSTQPSKQTKKKTNYLFTSTYAQKVTHMSRQSFWHILNTLWKKTGSKRTISPHKLRHSFATHMLKNGADLRSLQLLLGHENLSTVQIYTHVEMSHLRAIYNKKHSRS